MENVWINRKNGWVILAVFLAMGLIGRFNFFQRKESKKLIPLSASKELEIKVRKGWCLSTIAEDLGTSVEDLARLNKIQNVNLIYAGQTLKIVPYNRTSKVKVSWYGSDFHGKAMSNKKSYDMYNPTITAHKLLPFNTKVRLRRTDNGKCIIVVVQDRGPYVKGRSFDISYAAAEILGIKTIGVAECEVEILN